MNCFFVIDDNRLVTPNLTGSLLPGVTRDSILTLGSDLGFEIEERQVSMEEWGNLPRRRRLAERGLRMWDGGGNCAGGGR